MCFASLMTHEMIHSASLLPTLACGQRIYQLFSAYPLARGISVSHLPVRHRLTPSRRPPLSPLGAHARGKHQEPLLIGLPLLTATLARLLEHLLAAPRCRWKKPANFRQFATRN